MPKEKKNEVAPEEVATPVEEPKTKSAKVYRNGVLQREYTPELHGKGFKEAAAEFAGKHGYEVVVK